MTVEEFLADFEDALYTSLNVNKQRSPYKTGNLRNNAIKIMKTANGYKIWCDLSVAPYAQYLDDKPSIKQRYPESWWDHICIHITTELMKKYNRKEFKTSYQEGYDDWQSVRKFNKSDKAMREWNKKYGTPIIVGNPSRDPQT